MTGRVRKAAAAVDGVSKMELQRVRVGADGYDATGTYWGAGPDVFIARIPRLQHDASLQDGAQQITVRAKTVGEARTKVEAELARAPGGAKVGPRDPLGGASPNKTRYEIDWRDPVAGAHTRIRITHARDYLGMGQDHVEVESLLPKKAALPISETGYRSQFLTALELINAGGPVTFVTAWLEREAKAKDWQNRQAARNQGDLFQWADTNAEVAKPKVVTKPKRRVPKPAPARANRRDPA